MYLNLHASGGTQKNKTFKNRGADIKVRVWYMEVVYHINHFAELGTSSLYHTQEHTDISGSQIPLTSFNFEFLLIIFRQSNQWTGHRKHQINTH